jgi:hypothetical protein
MIRVVPIQTTLKKADETITLTQHADLAMIESSSGEWGLLTQSVRSRVEGLIEDGWTVVSDQIGD